MAGRCHAEQQPLEHRLLLTATFCLLAGGAVMVYSASSARTLLEGQGDGTAYLVKYLTYGAVGLVAMHLLSRHGLEHVRRYTPCCCCSRSRCCVLVLLPGFGVRINGARRWLGAGPLQFQPSEIMKLALVLHAAAVLSTRPKLARSLRTLAGPVIGVGGAAVLLIMAQPDLGTALVICFTIAAMLVAAGVPMRQLGLVAARRRVPGAALRDPRALPARAPDELPEPVGARRRRRASSRSRARSRSAPAACSASARASRCRRSSTCPRPTPTSSWP